MFGNSFIFIQISLKSISNGPFENKVVLVQILAWDNRQQAISRTDDCLVYRRMSLSLDELKTGEFETGKLATEITAIQWAENRTSTEFLPHLSTHSMRELDQLSSMNYFF